MDKSYENKYHSLEETHWWFESRRDVIFNLIRLENKKSKILEIGCSGGPLLNFLKGKGFENVYGVDISKEAIGICKQKGLKNIFVMDGSNTKFKDQEFDIIIASDVLEHILDDQKAVKEWHRILKVDGKVIVFVPAFNFLQSSHDLINHHHRRYTKDQLIRIIKKSNFEITKSSYWNFVLFFPALFFRLFQNFFKRDDSVNKDHLFILNPLLNYILILLLKFENIILNFLKYPFGVSVFVVGKKIN